MHLYCIQTELITDIYIVNGLSEHAFCAHDENFLKNLQISLLPIERTTEGGAHPPGLTIKERQYYISLLFTDIPLAAYIILQDTSSRLNSYSLPGSTTLFGMV